MEFSDLVRELQPSYLAARREEVRKMHDLLDASDFERLTVLSHSLKGSGSSFGFPELTRIGGEMERHAGAQDANSFARDLMHLQQILDHLGDLSNSPTST